MKSNSRHVIVIAEAGVNHNGDMKKAEQLIKVAADAGADYVKFQTFKAEALSTASAELAEYQSAQVGLEHKNQLEMLKKLELSPEQHNHLIKVAGEHKIKFFSTAFDLDSVDFLKQLKLGAWKVPSGEITNRPFLEKLGSFNEMTFLSTGMSEFREVQEAVSVLLESGLAKEKLTVLHCNSQYPSPFEDVHLNAMVRMGRDLGLPFGYSDHTLGIEVALAAVALGATVIEKHFTLDRQLPGPDHKASLEPQELKQMISGLRHLEKALGQDEKKPSPSEMQNRSLVRKSIVAKTAIKKGDIFTIENITTKRPGTGKSPMKWREVLGNKSNRDYRPDEMIE